MKTRWFASVVCLLLAHSVMAETVFKITKSSGFTPPEFSYSRHCDIRTDTVSIQTHTQERVSGTLTPKVVQETHSLVFTTRVPDITAVKIWVATAKNGTMQEILAPVDGPSSTYVGVIEGPVVDEYVKIALYSGGSGRFRENSERLAREALVEFADENCPAVLFRY